MLVFGDVVASLAILFGSAAAAWGAMLLAALLFPNKSAQAARRLENEPWKCFTIGLLGLIFVSIPTLILLNLPNPAIKTIGFILLCAVLTFAGAGTAGILHLVAGRIVSAGGSEKGYGAMTRAGLIVVGSMLMPIFGWFFLAPLALIMGFGAALATLMTRSQPIAEPSPEAP